jgi:putative endonuclease
MISYHVYVLCSKSGNRFYIGVTEDVVARLGQHNAGASKRTKRHAGTWRVVWTEHAGCLGDARRLETWLKKQKGGVGRRESIRPSW